MRRGEDSKNEFSMTDIKEHDKYLRNKLNEDALENVSRC
jgi:hypothetical protein